MATYPVINKETGEQKEVAMSVHVWDQWKKANYGLKRLQGLITFMKSEDWSNRMIEFREYITIMDKVRKTNFSKTFPEMKDLINE